MGLGWAGVVHPGDRVEIIRRYERAWRDKTAFLVVFRLRHHSGEYRWVCAQGKPDLGPSGEVLGFSGYGDLIPDCISDPESMVSVTHPNALRIFKPPPPGFCFFDPDRDDDPAPLVQ